MECLNTCTDVGIKRSGKAIEEEHAAPYSNSNWYTYSTTASGNPVSVMACFDNRKTKVKSNGFIETFLYCLLISAQDKL